MTTLSEQMAQAHELLGNTAPVAIHRISHWHKWQSSDGPVESEQLVWVAEYPSGLLIRITTNLVAFLRYTLETPVTHHTITEPNPEGWRDVFPMRKVYSDNA